MDKNGLFMVTSDKFFKRVQKLFNLPDECVSVTIELQTGLPVVVKTVTLHVEENEIKSILGSYHLEPISKDDDN